MSNYQGMAAKGQYEVHLVDSTIETVDADSVKIVEGALCFSIGQRICWFASGQWKSVKEMG